MCSAYTPVYDAEPTLHQHWFTTLCMLGHLHSVICDTKRSAWIETGLVQMMLGRLQANHVSRPDKQHNIDYRCSADPMRFNVGPASATSDQYCISIGSTYRGCWVDLKPCGITILMVTEYHPSLISSAAGWRGCWPLCTDNSDLRG